jgi:hypothetical protein
MRQNPFLQQLKDDNTSTLSTIAILRQLNQAGNAPTAVMQKVWRELTYVGIWVHKAPLLVAFNAIAVFLFFWLLSLL